MNKNLKENSGVKSEISPADGKPKLGDSYFKCRFFNKRQFLVEFICKAENKEEAEREWNKKYKNRYNLLEILPL